MLVLLDPIYACLAFIGGLGGQIDIRLLVDVRAGGLVRHGSLFRRLQRQL